MARTVGEVKFLVDFDGKGLPAKTKALGEEMGDGAGQEFKKNFSKHLTELGREMRAQMLKEGRESGESYGQSFSDSMRDIVRRNKTKNANILADVFGTKEGFADFAKDFERPQEAIDSLRAKMHELRNEGGLLPEEFKKMDLDLRALKRTFNGMDKEAQRVADGMEAIGKQLRGDLINHLGEVADESARVDREIGGLSQDLRRDLIQSLSDTEREAERSRRAMNELNIELADMDFDKQARDVGDFRRRLGEIDPAARGARGQLDNLRTSFDNIDFRHQTVDLDELRNHFRSAGEDIERAERRVTQSAERGERAMARFKKTVGLLRGVSKNFFIQWGDLPYGIKQAAFYVGLFAGLAPAIATLGSVAGSSLAVIGAGALALGVGVATAVAGFKGITGPLDKVAASARPAATALQAMKTPLHEIQQTIQGHIFDGLTGPIKNLTNKLLPVLNDKLAGVADSVGDFFAGIAGGLTSKNGLSDVSKLLGEFKPILKNLGDAVINLGAAFGAIFVAALPSLKTFSGFLSTLFGDFNKFLRSADGQTALATFFKHLNDLAGPLAGLLGAAGKALAGMVTDKSVGNLSEFLDTMSKVFPGISDLVNIIGDLDPLGIVADAIKAITDAISANKGPLSTLAGTIGDLIKSGIKDLAPLLSDILKNIIPVAQAFADQLGPAIKTLLPSMIDFVEKVLPPLADLLIEVAPLIPPIAEALAKVLPPLTDLVTYILTEFLPAFKVITDTLGLLVTPTENLGSAFGDLKDDIYATTNSGAGAWAKQLGLDIRHTTEDIVRRVETMGSQVGTGIDVMVGFFTSIPGRVLAGLAGFITKVAQAINVAPRVPGIVSAVVSTFGGLPGRVLATLAGFVGRVISKLDFSHGVPGIISSAVRAFSGLPGRILSTIGNIGDQISRKLSFHMSLTGDGGVLSRVNSVLSALRSVAGNFVATVTGKANAPKTAIGGVFNTAQLRTIGEAGPEAVVPLNRPLSQVDPAVRAISAFAQGLNVPGRTTSGGRQINVAEGAIKMFTASADPYQAAEQTLDRLVALLN